MQQTETYKLNLIQPDDPFSPQPLNENMDKVEGALAALTAQLVTRDSLRVVLGRYQGRVPTDDSVGQIIDLGERPLAVFVCSQNGSGSSNHSGFIVLDGKCKGEGTNATAMELRDNGFWVHNVLNYGTAEYRFIAFFGDWPLKLLGKNDVEK